MNHLNDPYWAEEDLRLLGLSNQHGYAILPESDKTVTMIQPSSKDESVSKDFLVQKQNVKTNEKESKPAQKENVQINGLDKYLTNEDYLEIEKTGSDIPESDKTVTTI